MEYNRNIIPVKCSFQYKLSVCLEELKFSHFSVILLDTVLKNNGLFFRSNILLLYYWDEKNVLYFILFINQQNQDRSNDHWSFLQLAWHIKHINWKFHLRGCWLSVGLALDDKRLVVFIWPRLDLEKQFVGGWLFDYPRWTLNWKHNNWNSI